MRCWALLVLACLLGLLASGCLDEKETSDEGDGTPEPDDGTPGPADPPPPGPPPQTETNDTGEAPKPEDFEDSQMVAGGVDAGNFVTGDICNDPVDPCERYPFTVERGTTTRPPSWDMVAVLSWTTDAHDFDLHLYQGGQSLDSSADPAPETEERITRALGPGEYEIVVVPWAVSVDTFTLTVSFS